MAKLKSVKFYNFNNKGVVGCLSVKFYNIYGNLINMDFSNPMPTATATYCETSEYIASSTCSECYQAFHTGNFDKTVHTKVIGYTWAANNSADWVKIEFKIPLLLSNIRINHTYSVTNFFDSCDYDIQYDNDVIETYSYVSDGTFAPYAHTTVYAGSYDQEIYDALFDSIEFSKSKQIYDSEIGQIETLDTNNFRNIPVNNFEALKVLYTKPLNTYTNCLVSFDQKQTWKTFNGTIWSTISNTSPENIILNCMDIETLNLLTKQNLIQAGFTGDIDFKIAIKTNDEKVTPSVSKIYVTYKNHS